MSTSWSLRSQRGSEFKIIQTKIDRSLKTPRQEYGIVAVPWWWAPGADYLCLHTVILQKEGWTGTWHRHSPGQLSHLLAPRIYQSVPVICWFAEASWFGEAPYKTWTRDSIWPGQVPMGRNLPVLDWWISLICTFHFGCSHCRPKLVFYRGRMGPQKGQKCRKPLRKCDKLFMGGVSAGVRDMGHKANPRDVAMHMKGMRDRSGKMRFQEWQCNPRIDKFKKSYIQYSSVLLQL